MSALDHGRRRRAEYARDESHALERCVIEKHSWAGIQQESRLMRRRGAHLDAFARVRSLHVQAFDDCAITSRDTAEKKHETQNGFTFGRHSIDAEM